MIIYEIMSIDYISIVAAYLTQYKSRKDERNKHMCCLVVDTGYSFTHIVPYCEGKKVNDGIKR